MNNIIIVLISAFLFLTSCKNEKPIPKPYGYKRFSFEKKEYQTLDKKKPYIFDYPTYTLLEKDKAKDTKDHWINIVFPKLNGKIHISYLPVKNNLIKLTEDAYKLAYQHSQFADAIEEKQFINEAKNVYGLIYLLKGNTASPIQFYATDSIKNFIRGSLYFNTYPNKDSLNPVISYVYTDIVRLMESLEWNKK